MRKQILSILTAVMALLIAFPQTAYAAEKEGEGVNVKEIIFHHLGDGYGWEVPFSHVYRIPLPVIVRSEDGKWFCFSSTRLLRHVVEVDPETGKEHMENVAEIVNLERDDKTYQFVLAHVSKHENKVVQLFPLSAEEEADVKAQAADMAKNNGGLADEQVIDGYVGVNGTYYREYKPWDISITKNVLALFLSVLIVTAAMMSVARYYKRKGFKAPRKGMGFMEMLINFIYTDMIKASLHERAKKYAPFLLTCFFFILTMNLLGLIVIFPGGANLTGNISVTLVLAVLVFIVTNINGSKHYWKEIFWPDVPLFLKFPIPIMQFIEIFGVFTKPAALCVRLFANMMGGHMIVITLTILIFIFAAFGTAAAAGTTVVSIFFSIFMLAIDVLVSFIQAYVFTLLATIFISMSTEEGHHEEKHENIEKINLNENAESAVTA